MQSVIKQEDIKDANPKLLMARVSESVLSQIKDQPVVLLVSIGKEKFEAEDLKAQLAFIAEHCQYCTILAADTLQRFNIAYEHCADHGFSLEKANTVALAKGDEWINKYQDLFDQQFPKKNYRIVRWKSWANHPKFHAQKQIIAVQLKNDADYEKAMQRSISEYQARKETQLGKETFNAYTLPIFKQHCRAYLIEECAVFLLMAQQNAKRATGQIESAMLYPGSPQAIIAQTFEKLIAPVYPKALEWIPLRFKRVQPLSALMQKSAFLKETLFNLPTHVYWKDEQGRYVWCNEAHLASLGLKNLHEIMGKTDADLVWKEQADKLKSIDQHVLETGQSYQLEESVKLSDQVETIFLSKKSPVKNKAGKSIGILGVSVDITERKQAEQALKLAKEKAETAHQAKTAFLENMRHDIRTPLTGIISFAEIIKKEASTSALTQQADYLVKASHALLDFMNQILKNIQHQSHDNPIKKTQFNLKDILESVIDLHQPAAKAKNILLSLSKDKGLPEWVIGDEERIRHILLELVANALKFTDSGNVKISVKLKPQAKNKKTLLILSVADTGMGIASDKQSLIFEPFVRLSPAPQGLYKGAGLGLTTVKKYVEGLKGKIKLESELNQGSIFTCSLPIQTAGIKTKEIKKNVPTQQTPAQTTIEHQSIQILLVEDDEIAAFGAQALLEDLGCTVDIAPNGKTALNLFSSKSYALVFMDIGLPDISGDEVTRLIRQYDQKTPILALSAHVSVDNQDKFEKAGINRCLEKPLSMETAKAILAEFALPETSTQALVETSPISIENKNKNGQKVQDNKPLDLDLAAKAMPRQSVDLAKKLIRLLMDDLPKNSDILKTGRCP